MANKTLIIGPSWVGDMVLAQSLFKVLKQQDAQMQIDVAAPAWTLPILKRMPEVDQTIALPFSHGKFSLWQRIQLGRAWRSQGYDRAILLPNSWKSAIAPFFAGIKIRTGFRGEMRYGLLNDIRRLDKQALPRTVDRFVSLAGQAAQDLAQIPNPSLQVDQSNVKTLVKQWHIDTRKKILGLCPGAEYGEAKRWPAQYYADVARKAIQAGWQVFLFGSTKDQAVTQNIAALTGQACRDFAGQTSLGDAVDLMSLCHTVISNDSGLMHIAAALDKPLIAIYGSSDPHHTPPMSPQAVVEYLALECSPCFARTCKLGHLNCLKHITPDRIIQKIGLVK